MKLKEILKAVGLKPGTKEGILEKLAHKNEKLEVLEGFQPNTYDFTVTNGEKQTNGVLYLKNQSWKIKKLDR